MTEAVAVNRKLRVAVLDDGTTEPMRFFIDCLGDETDDAFEAVTAIVSLPDGDWVFVDLTEFDSVVFH